jgi:hypothetical protein
MNQTRIAWLGGLLLLQLVAAAGLLFARGGFGEPETGPLLAIDATKIDRLLIEESADKSIALVKRDGRWFVAQPAAAAGEESAPPGADLPADAGKIDELLEKLAGLKAPWAVATTASARDRFEVGDENRQRHLLLESEGKTTGELLLGTSPGFRRLHVRIPGSDEIYEVDLTHFELSTTADEWLDKDVLRPTGEIVAISREGGWRLARSDDGWMLDDGAADSSAAEQMIERFANLRVLGVATTAPAADAKPAATFAVTDGKGQYKLELFGTPDGAEYVVASDRQAARYRLAQFIGEQLLADGATLMPSVAPEGAPSAGAAPDSTAGGEVPPPPPTGPGAGPAGASAAPAVAPSPRGG